MQNVGQLQQRLDKNVQDLWGNQSELKNGMDAAEFNLRAHQKVLNGLAIEVERLSNLVSKQMQPDVEPEEMKHLQMANVKVPTDEEGGTETVRRIDWPYYHKQVEHDLEILAEYERQRELERQARAAEVGAMVEQLRKDNDADALKDMAARIAKGEQLLEGFELTAEDAKLVCDQLNLGPIEAKKEAPEEEPPEGDEFPEGAVVFGGDDDGVQESDPGDGEPEEDDRCEAHGASGDVPEGEVPEEVLGVRGGEQHQQG